MIIVPSAVDANADLRRLTSAFITPQSLRLAVSDDKVKIDELRGFLEVFRATRNPHCYITQGTYLNKDDNVYNLNLSSVIYSYGRYEALDMEGAAPTLERRGHLERINMAIYKRDPDKTATFYESNGLVNARNNNSNV